MIFKLAVSKVELPTQCLLHNKPEHNCKECVWWIMKKNERAGFTKTEFIGSKFEIVKDTFITESSRNNYGYLLAYEESQHLIGLLQFGPKRAFPYLEDLKEGSTRNDKWFVACLQSKENSHGVKVELLREMIHRLDKEKIQYPCIQAAVLKNSIIKKVNSSGSAEPYLDAGFVQRTEIDEDFVLLEYVP